MNPANAPPAALSTLRVLVADEVDAEALRPLTSDSRFEVISRTGLSPSELTDAIAGVEAVIVRSSTRITRDVLERADRLRVIGRAGVGVDTIDVEAATERGIAVLNAPAGNTVSAAELTFALILALARRVPQADRSMRAGKWDRKRFSGVELRGKTLGLIGAGRIGSEVARLARGFGMKVVAHDPYLDEERASALNVRLATMDEVLGSADVVSVHVPLTDATAGLIAERELALMRPTAFLVNAARGGVVKETALVHALKSRGIAGAALDVFEQEPLPADHPLRSFDNVVLTPHLGASTVEAQHSVASEISLAIRAALLEGDLSRAVNAPAVGGDEMRRLRPLLNLAERLGLLAAALSQGPRKSVTVKYAGAAKNALGALTASALVGVMAPVLGKRAVNFVNSIHLAEQRGINVERVAATTQADYTEFLEVQIRAANDTRVAGALLGEGHPRLVRIGDYHVDVLPRGTLVVLRNRDVPGVIGRVGSILGAAGVNIAEYHQARIAPGAEALAAISVDGRLSAEVCDQLKAVPDIIDVRQAQLD